MSLSFLADGKVDAYTEENIMIWDVAAGIAIVKAAGGNVRFTQGEAKNSLFVSATNGSKPKCHQRWYIFWFMTFYFFSFCFAFISLLGVMIYFAVSSSSVKCRVFKCQA